MKLWLKRMTILLGVLVLLLIIVAGWYLSRAIPIGTGYVAKYLCSSTFISGRDPVSVFEEDIKPVNPLAKVIKWQINKEEKSVVARSLLFFRSKAIYRPGCGCTLLVGSNENLGEQQFYKSAFEAPAPVTDSNTAPLREDGVIADTRAAGFDREKLVKAVDAAFMEPSPDNPRKTRAVLVVKDGQFVAEKYAPGFDRTMRLPGWSMTKSVTNALVGILVQKGLLDIHAPAHVPEWQQNDDPRREITLDQLLRMSSGLQFEEVYDPLYDATDMLYGAADFAAFAAAKPLEAAPDEKWYYSSGTANIVARIVRQEAEKLYAHYYDFIRQELFYKIGMTSAIIEPDMSGTFVGSSYCFATPREWARFGQFYLNDGVWNGERILPEGWVKYSTTPTAKAPMGEYGAFFWLNAGMPDNPKKRLWPDAPREAYAAQGYQEQMVIVVPSEKLVLLRFGATSDRSAWSKNDFIKSVLASLE